MAACRGLPFGGAPVAAKTKLLRFEWLRVMGYSRIQRRASGAAAPLGHGPLGPRWEFNIVKLVIITPLQRCETRAAL
jgi:hypothetical protein